MKAQGIVVYTITFALNDETAQQIYEDCASDPSKYYNSPNSADLQDAFQEIGGELRNLRLSR
ncbi:MAG: hypothetical protein IH993_00110 [Proteobacteria bacterium]|nr:hypothetical protein [Pseudomonadota bacterium]